MMASRRLASPARPPGETQLPASSGPRWAIDSRIASSTALSTGGPSPMDTIPHMPHMSALRHRASVLLDLFKGLVALISGALPVDRLPLLGDPIPIVVYQHVLA